MKMRSAVPLILGVLAIPGLVSAETAPKTLIPEKIDPLLIGNAPYRFNGVVETADGRGSGFCAWSSRAIFSAAHVVWGEDGWGAPPIWHSMSNGEALEEEDQIQTRGYFRWKQYASLVAATGQTRHAFGRDVILAYAFEDLISGQPAVLDLNGFKNLQGSSTSMITGYPAENAYTAEPIEGYFLHQTGPGVTPYKVDHSRALRTTLITTGPGNSGGPVWIQQQDSSWKAAGVLVGGMPSETIVYSFSSDVNALTRAAAPLVKPKPENPVTSPGVTAGSYFFAMNKPKRIPDGVTRYTDFRFTVGKFEEGAELTTVKLTLDIETAHQGDLLIILQGPRGIQEIVHNEQGGGTQNLILTSKDFSSAFKGIYPNGNWSLRVQDRLRGDVATVKQVLLEIGVEGSPDPAPAP